VNSQSLIKNWCLDVVGLVVPSVVILLKEERALLILSYSISPLERAIQAVTLSNFPTCFWRTENAAL
jgi:hypothetical protein